MMEGFWLWFWRLFAEIASIIVLSAGIIALLVFVALIGNACLWVKEKFTKKAD
jgi:hypothetical protein